MRAYLAAFGLTIASLLAALPARAQCTTCSPLSLPSGTLVGQELSAARRADWTVLGRLETGWTGFRDQVVDGEPVQEPSEPTIDLWLSTLQLGLLHRSGFGLELVLPGGILSSRSNNADGGRDGQDDFSLGDLEIRPRWTGLLTRALRGTVVAGAVAPTGNYAPRSGALSLSESANALTVGRGVPWLLAEGELRAEVVRTVAAAVGLAGRVPVGRASDGLEWGNEVRANAEAQWSALRYLRLGVGFEWQWRGRAIVDDPFTGMRVDNGNVGGSVWSVTPSVLVNSPETGLFGSLTARIPVAHDLDGFQFVPGPGIFLGFGAVVPLGGGAAKTSREPPRSKGSPDDDAATPLRFVVREYSATWCAACKKLTPKLHAFEARRPDVRVEIVDITDWTEDQLDQEVGDVGAMPILEIRRPDGTLVKRLTGEKTLDFASHLPPPGGAPNSPPGESP